MIDSCAEQAWHLQFEEVSELVGKKCKKAIDEEKEDQHPFKRSINQEVREATQFLLYKTFEGSFHRHDPEREMYEMLIQVESFEDEMEDHDLGDAEQTQIMTFLSGRVLRRRQFVVFDFGVEILIVWWIAFSYINGNVCEGFLGGLCTSINGLSWTFN
ncbi:hypothetical protein SLE2022_375870 [Rubroshorea leprosula]